MHLDVSQLHHRAAITTATSLVSAGVAQYSGLGEVVQITAGIVAIFSGCAAIVYYLVGTIEKLRNMRK